MLLSEILQSAVGHRFDKEELYTTSNTRAQTTILNSTNDTGLLDNPILYKHWEVFMWNNALYASINIVFCSSEEQQQIPYPTSYMVICPQMSILEYIEATK